VFFSLSGSKRPGYILPALPPLALALGCYLNVILPRERLRSLGGMLVRHRSLLAHQALQAILILGGGASVAGMLAGLVDVGLGCLFTGASVLGLLLLYRRRQPRTASWALCSVATFALLLAGVHQFLPAYHRRFSLRGQVRPLAALTQDPKVAIACYPRRWDSVSFYLRRDDVQVYTPDLRDRLIADLRGQPETLLFVKSQHLSELLSELPDSLEFVPHGRRGTLTAGWVRPRAEATPFLYARH